MCGISGNCSWTFDAGVPRVSTSDTSSYECGLDVGLVFCLRLQLHAKPVRARNKEKSYLKYYSRVNASHCSLSSSFFLLC